MKLQALVESGVDGKSSSGDKYESHTQISDLTIIFADTRMILVKRTKVSSRTTTRGIFRGVGRRGGGKVDLFSLSGWS